MESSQITRGIGRQKN